MDMPTTGQMVKLLTTHPDMTYQAIGEIMGCSRQRVHQVAQQTGLTKKSRFFRLDITVEKVVELYYGSNLLVQDIARIFGCDLNTIRKRLRAGGISSRESYSRKEKLYWRWVRGELE